jgi:hypothetical protein
METGGLQQGRHNTEKYHGKQCSTDGSNFDGSSSIRQKVEDQDDFPGCRDQYREPGEAFMCGK